MPATSFRWRQAVATFRLHPGPPYHAFREALRVAIPYKWRRFAVQSVWRRLRPGSVDGRPVAPPPPPTRRQPRDFHEAVRLLPFIPPQTVQAILDRPVRAEPGRPLDVICFSIVDWSFRFQRPQQLMMQFALHGHRVFYLNVTEFLSPRGSRRYTATPIGAYDGLFEVKLATTEPLDIYREAFDGAAAEEVLRALDELRRDRNINDAIGYVMIPSWSKVAREAQRRWGWRIVYDCMDEWENFPNLQGLAIAGEGDLVRSCDLLVVTAARLAEKWRAFGRTAVLARNAADYEFYADRCRPNELLANTDRPVVGYFGAIADWFDVELAAEIARQRPGYEFVFLGGVFDVDVSALQSLPNVRLLGQQPYETMPQYLYHFGVCIIPFKINPITEATDPVKLYEYLSGGKPVVSIRLPELEPYREVVYLADDAAGFAAQLDAALAEDSPAKAEARKAVARQHTWKNRYERIVRGLAEATPCASIIIVTYNNLALTRLCLESVARNTAHPNYEVIVVDNRSKDGTPAYLRERAAQQPNLKILLNDENHGFARANNQGIEIATGEHLVLLNNDTIVPPGWLSRLLWHLNDPAVGLVGPVTNFAGNEARIPVSYANWLGMEEFSSEHTWARNTQIADIHVLAMFCVAMRREVFTRIGPLDERFGIGMFEDDDYSMRVRQAGLRVVCAADVFVHHFGQAAFGKLIEDGAYNPLFDENRRKYEAKWQTVWAPHRNADLTFAPHVFKAD